MLIDGIELVEGSEIQNLGVPIGTAFPSLPNFGELFYRSDEDKLYIYSNGASTWVEVAKGVSGSSKWLIETADKIYHVDDVTVGATASISGKKFYVLGDVQFDGALEMGTNAITVTAAPTLADHLANKGYVDTEITSGDALKVDKAGDTMTGALDMGSNQITLGLSPTLGDHAANKGYVDGFVSGIVWDSPLRHSNIIGDTLSTPPGSPNHGDVYLVAGTGTGAWTGFDGNLAQWDGGTWVDQGTPTTGMRFGVAFESSTVPIGAFAGLKNNIATYNGAGFDFATPVDKRAVFVSYASSAHAWHQYVYQTSDSSWTEFGGPNTTIAGDNLEFVGNRMNVVGGPASGLDADTLDGSQLTDLDAKYVDVSGDTMTGALVMGSNKITSSGVPIVGDDLTNKTFVDAEIVAAAAESVSITGDTMTGELVAENGIKSNAFIMPEIDQILTSTTVVDSFIYDTTQDSDGGNWRYSKKSWYNEARPSGKYLGRFANVASAASAGGVTNDWYQRTTSTDFYRMDSTSTETEIFRAGSKHFPKLALIVAENNQVIIYDLGDFEPSMWMVVIGDAGGSGVLGWASSIQVTLSSIAAKESYIVVCGDNRLGMITMNFASDDIKLGYSTIPYTLTSGRRVLDRNNITSFSTSGDGYIIINSIVNDVAITVLPNAPIDSVTGLKIPTIAVFTNSGISVITNTGVVYDVGSSAVYGSGDIKGDTLTGITLGTSHNWVLSAINADGFATFATYTDSSIPALLGTSTVVDS